MKSILNNKAATIGYEKVMWAMLVLSLVFGLYITLFNEWGTDLAASQGGAGENISALSNSHFKDTRNVFNTMKIETKEVQDELFDEEKETGAFGITYKGGVAAFKTLGTAAINLPIVLRELFTWVGIPEWVIGIISTIIALTVIITIIKAFVTKGQEV